MEHTPSSSSGSTSTPCLPKPGDLSKNQVSFLNQQFQTHQDLVDKTHPLHTSLLANTSHLDSHLQHLKSTFSHLTVSWIRRSFTAKNALHNVDISLQNLSLVTSQGGSGWKKLQRVLGTELPPLAKQVQQVETIRSYLETTLQLEALVGDLEDAVFCFVNSHSGKMFSAMLSNSSNSETKQEKLLQAIKALDDLEVLVGLVKLRPQWHHLLKSVDARVDKTLAILRPQVIADHRALLASFGWPPKLSAFKIQSELSGLPNPLASMQGEQRKCYSNSFLALCALQHIQTRRENRQLNLSGQKECIIQLWGIDELVSPIASRMEYHFSKWVDQPVFIFELAYKITRDFIVGVDDVLQPLIDRARLTSYSAKEAWVSSMVQPLSDFLAKRLFSSLAEKYKEKQMKSEVILSWLHLIDLIVLFDKRIQSLLKSETSLFSTDLERVESLSGNTSVLIIFGNRPDWLKIWAKIELKNACNKLKTDLKDERAWTLDGEGAELPFDTQQFLISTREDHKAPLIAESALKITWEMVERCQTMPVMLPRSQFIRLTAVRFLWFFFKVLLLQCKRTEITPDNPDDGALVRVCGSINAAKYIESKLRQWSDDATFLEMKLAENDPSNRRKDEKTDLNFFGEEIQSLSELATKWLMEIISVLLRQFETLSWEYVQKMKHYDQDLAPLQASGTVVLTVSVDFVEPLDALRCHLILLRMTLNATDFFDLWRSLAQGLDHFISCSNITCGIHFSDRGINQFETDMRALFSIFQPFCVRPEAFFPSTREIMKQLKMKKRKTRGICR